MDREGFRNRLKQYKLAREENPGLKYWEWKNIPKYNEGVDGVPPQKYRVVGKDPEFKEAAQSAIDWTTNWHDARKATGEYDEQYESISPFIKRPTAIVLSNLGGDKAGTFTGAFENAVVRVDPNTSPWWGNTTESAIVHELAHETSAQNIAKGMPASQAKGSAIIDKVSEITGSPKFYTNEPGSQYENSAVEEYARLQLMRHAMKADPTKKYDLFGLKSWLKKFSLPDDERGVRLMNEVAQADINSKSRLYTAAEGGVIPKYDEGVYSARNYSTEENPMFYKEESAKDRYIRAANTLKKVGGWSNNLRDEIANEYSILYLPEKEIRLTTGRYNTGKISTNLLDSIYNSAMRTGVPVDIALGLAGRESTLGIGRGFKKGQSISGTNLMSNWLQIDPDIPSSKDRDKFNDIRSKILFHDDVSDDEYNFSADYIFDDINSRKRLKKIKEHPIDNALKFYQSGKYNPGDKKHSQMVEEDARILMSDPAIKKWALEKGIAYAEGTDGVLESYYNPTTVEGVLAKTALQLADPTGVSSYPDVLVSGKEFLKSPSWAKLGDVGLNTLSALPLIGKVTAPFKAAKMAKLLTRIEDANALVKGVEKANRLNRAIDTVPELLPVVRKGAEKVQDVTSSLITNPMFNYISNQNKFDLVRNYRNVNAAVDAVNISNNTADLTQGMGALIGYGK